VREARDMLSRLAGPPSPAASSAAAVGRVGGAAGFHSG